ncbi:MAG: hypothetical protein LBL80_05100 [Ruminococcus sp.]|jgi:rubrerythrin|nr:hypothetical protein [Ruminococcus sp.]
MKKDDLIKLAASRGITINEEQAEKFTELSDEELENLASGGGCIYKPDGGVLGKQYDCRSCGYRVSIKDSDVPEGQPPVCPLCGSANLKYQGKIEIMPEIT